MRYRKLGLVLGLGLLAAMVVGTASAARGGGAASTIVYQVRPLVQPAGTAAFTNPFCHYTGDPSMPQLVCYSPADIRSAYGYPAGLDGSGQTIVIVDAYGSPTIESDLATFDAKFGLPAPPSFTVECPQGCPAFSPYANGGNEVGWAEETSLDVEWAHAMAPGASIVLVVAPTSYGNAINVAERTAIREYPGAIISQSFGSFESDIGGLGNNIQLQQAHRNYEAARAAGDTVLASAGDFGATNLGLFENAVYPASDPLVTGVGGTQGDQYYNGRADSPLPDCSGGSCSTGLVDFTCSNAPASNSTCTPVGYGGEQVWNEPFYGAATGGAESLVFSTPDFQAGDGMGATMRTVPDVSYNASVSGGVLVYLGFLGAGSGFYIVGGTSAGAPQWAAIIALANQARGQAAEPNVGYLNPTLYSLAESGSYSSLFHDITVGNNQLDGTPFGYSAGSGYDVASGWGTPQVGNLVSALVGP